MQRGKVIAYASPQLKIHEKNYTTHDLELGAVVFALKTWRHYLYGMKSVIYTDHKSPHHIFDQKELNMRQRRWIKLFSDFDSEISYHSSIGCAPFEALYGRKCRSPVLWAEIGESRLIGPELMQETTNKCVWKERHVSIKKYLADANLHVHLEEIKVDKTLRFVEEPVEIIDREVKSLKRSRIPIVKVY
ncbi:putative reverse transcriptase domain-containing protein [Tanacetum coccineum]